jgi:hypothetical protein
MGMLARTTIGFPHTVRRSQGSSTNRPSTQPSARAKSRRGVRPARSFGRAQQIRVVFGSLETERRGRGRDELTGDG